MEETLKTIITNLVEFPEQVSINKKEDDKNLIFEVKVAETDMGKVIGREGKMAGAIRTVMKALGAKESKRITIEFIG